RFGKVHPATKTFQALRIAINGELTHLLKALEDLPQFLSPNGRMLIISFHSLEDRIVKQAFKKLADTGGYSLINKKPIIPGAPELAINPRSRSSKLRIIKRTI
ncbi:16S rRNA (cytosine(1402)-N(4))-methyltransferase, partial [Candidatus Nomurabacteria bacterium RIFCSPHIGHO2_02_FULL_33_12]